MLGRTTGSRGPMRRGITPLMCCVYRCIVGTPLMSPCSLTFLLEILEWRMMFGVRRTTAPPQRHHSSTVQRTTQHHPITASLWWNVQVVVVPLQRFCNVAVVCDSCDFPFITETLFLPHNKYSTEHSLV